MHILPINYNCVTSAYNKQPQKQTFAGKDFYLEREKFSLTAEAKQDAYLKNTDVAVSNILKIKKILVDQINDANNDLTEIERMGLIVDLVSLDSAHGFNYDTNGKARYYGEYLYTPEFIANIAQKLHKKNYGINDLQEPYSSFAEYYSSIIKSRTGGFFLTSGTYLYAIKDDPLRHKRKKLPASFKPIENYLEKKANALISISQLARNNADEDKIKTEIIKLKKMQVEQINDLNNGLSPEERTIIALELAYIDKISGFFYAGHYKDDFYKNFDTDMSSIPMRNFGINDLIEPYKAFAQVFVMDKRIQKIPDGSFQGSIVRAICSGY